MYPVADHRGFWDSRRLWSLREINFNLDGFITFRAILQTILSQAQSAARLDRGMVLTDAECKAVSDQIRLNRNCVDSIGLSGAKANSQRIINLLDNHKFQPANWGKLADLLQRLWDDLELHTQAEWFFHYPRDRAKKVLDVTADWRSVIDAYPSTMAEIVAGIDCWALGYNVACVFYMCRVAEIGLIAIGKERGVVKVRGHVPIEWGTWGQILQAIEPRIDDINQKPNGPQKEAAVAFYQAVTADLRAIKGLYRDQTMHLRESYDDGETQSAIFRSQSLMKMIATKLNVQSVGEIPWSAWP